MIRFALVLVVIAVLTGSGPEDRAVAPAASTADDPLSGRTFRSVSVTEGGADRPLVTGTHLELRFTTDGKLAVKAGCNGMSSPVTITGGTLRVGDLMTTNMGCDQPRMDQDAWFAEILKAGPRWQVEGTELTLTTDRTEIRFATQAPATPAPLIGTKWVVTGLVDGDSVGSLPAGVEAYLEFDGRRVTGNGGCNRLSGPAALGTGEIRFGPVVSTKMACGGTADATERAVMNVLAAGTVRMSVGPPLRLTAGEQGLVLEAR